MDWETFFEKRKSMGAIFIRVLIGTHLIIGVQDNIISWDRMLEFKDFLELQGFIFPLVSAIVSVYAQFICGVLYLIGWKVRYAAMVMTANFIVALLMVHIGDTYSGMFPALVMLLGSLFLLFNGSGSFSVEEYFSRKKN